MRASCQIQLTRAVAQPRQGPDINICGHRLFYAFNLDDHVPSNHLLRGINRFLDLSELHQHLAPFYSHTGRPSIDPQLLIRMSPMRSLLDSDVAE